MATGKADDKENPDSLKKVPKDATKHQKFWKKEITASHERVKKWHKSGTNIVARYEGKNTFNESTSNSDINTARLNLFHSNTITLMSMLYGNLPKIDVSRTHVDSKDDDARVAAETMERLLNLDVQENGKELDDVLRSTLQDRLIPGLGCARVRYDADIQVDPNTKREVTVSESVPIDYYFWKDVRWSWGRSFSTLRWLSFRTSKTEASMKKRFPNADLTDLDFKDHSITETAGINNAEKDKKDVRPTVDVWEIWDRETKKVYWYAEGAKRILDVKKDPLGLKGFFPAPPFFMANATTTNYLPTPDFKLCEDLYNQIDLLQARIDTITEAVRVTGVYDQSLEGIEQMLAAGKDNKLVPIAKYAMFAEKGGLAGAIDWFPIKDIVDALLQLNNQRDKLIALLQQVSGMSDIMRGGLDSAYEGVGQSKIKAKFGSIRVQALQDQFAQFVSDLMQLKAEIIVKHFDPANIAKRSNMLNSCDAERLPAAIKLLKDQTLPFRVVIRPESVAMADFAQLQNERSEFMNALSMFLQSAGPLMEKEPATTGPLLKMLQWTMAGFKGASEIEGVLDKAIVQADEAAKQRAANPPPDPAQIEQQKEQAKVAGQIQTIQAKQQSDLAVRDADLKADLQTIEAQSTADLKKIDADSVSDLAEIEAKMVANIQTAMADASANMEQTVAGIQAEMEKILLASQLKFEEMTNSSTLKMEEEGAKASMAIIAEKEKADASRSPEKEPSPKKTDGKPGKGETT